MNQKIEHALDLLADCERTADSVVNFFNFQLLGNADTLCQQELGQKENELLVENLIKKPFRRQIGRMKGLVRLHAEIKRELNAGINELRAELQNQAITQ